MDKSANNFVENVIESPEGQLRLVLLGAGLARRFETPEYEHYLRQIAATDSSAALAAEIARARNTTYDQTPQISFTTTNGQFLWSATFLHLFFLAAHDKKRFSDTVFFRHYVNQPVFQQELLRYAQTLSEYFDHGRTRIRWGEPLSWFYFSPDENIINLDPFHTTVFGLPRHPQDYAHSRAPAYHEVGHALLSTGLPKHFQHIIDRLKQLDDKNKKNPLTEPEQKEFIDQRIEAMLWGQFYNLAEDNVVNRFAVMLGRYKHGQNHDYGESLKYVYALINQSRKSFEDFKTDEWGRYIKSGQELLGKMTSSRAIDQFNAITKVLGLSVPVNEGMFANTKNDWEKAGLDWNAFMPVQSDTDKISSAAKILAEGDGHENSVSHHQPYAYRIAQDMQRRNISSSIAEAAERFFRYLTTSDSVIHALPEILSANEARNAVIEQLWQEYVAPLLPQIKDEIKQQLQQQGQQSAQDMADQISAPPSSGMGASGQSQKKPEQKPEKSSDTQDGQENDSASDKQNGEGAEQKEDGKDDAQGKAQDEKKSDDGADKGQEKPKSTNASKTLQDIIKDAEQQAANEGKRRQTQESQLESAIRQAQQTSQTVDYNFPEGDWSNYQAAKQKLAWLTNIFVRQLEEIRKKQITHQVARGRQLEMLPDGGEMDRLDLEAQFNLLARVGVQAPVRREDYDRFVGNKTIAQYATPQIVLLMDGSGSMKERMNGTEGVAPVDLAISTSVALYEATNIINARVTDPRPAFECYSGIWGPNNPTWLTAPGMESTEAGKNFDKFRKGLQSNTNLAPAITMVAKKLSTANSPAKNIGATHLFILSDGDIQDADATRKQVIKLVENVRNITVDVILISAAEDPRIVGVFRELKTLYPRLSYGVHRIDNLDQLPLTCLNAMKQRFTREIQSMPQSQKAAEFKRATL